MSRYSVARPRLHTRNSRSVEGFVRFKAGCAHTRQLGSIGKRLNGRFSANAPKPIASNPTSILGFDVGQSDAIRYMLTTRVLLYQKYVSYPQARDEWMVCAPPELCLAKFRDAVPQTEFLFSFSSPDSRSYPDR